MKRETEAGEILGKLTEREKEILLLVTEGGFSSQEAADEICISKRTVDFHLHNVYQKLGVNNRIKAYKRALELGIYETSQDKAA